MEPDFTEKERKIGGRVIIETLYNGISVYVDKETGYYSASKICRDTGKQMFHLRENQDYEAYKQVVSATIGIPMDELELIFEGLPNEYRGTWIQPLLVHTVCEWADKRYAVQVSMLMNEKAKQALIEKRTLQEQIDRERIHTERLEDELNEAKDNYKQAKKSYKKESKAHEETKAILTNIQAQLEASAEREKEKDAKIDELKETCDNLVSMNLQSDGKLDEANAKIDELLCYAEARDKDSSLFKSKMNSLNNKVSKLNASNYDDEGTVTFIWVLFRSESMTISYNKNIPDNSIWIYSQIREDKNKSIPDDAEILFEANVVSRTIYESLVRELEPMTIDTFYRHILISYENATAFIERLNELLDARGIQPETFNIEALNTEIETMKAKDEIKRKRAEARAQQIAIRQHIIDEAKFYIYIFGRWRRLYCKNGNGNLTTDLDASKFFYVRTGAGGVNIEHIQTRTLEHARFRVYGDARIRYE